MKPIDFTSTASADLRDIRDWISRSGSSHVVSFFDRLLHTLDLIAARPLMGRGRPEIGQGVRSFVHGNYVIFHRPSLAGITVLRILHGRRNLEATLFQTAVRPLSADHRPSRHAP